MKPRIYFRGGYWRCNSIPPQLSNSSRTYYLPLYIKAHEFCNHLNKVGRDNYQP